MTYRGIAARIMVGFLAGFLAGRLVPMLPIGWEIAIISTGCAYLFIWVFRSLRELREQARITHDLIAQLEEARRPGE